MFTFYIKARVSMFPYVSGTIKDAWLNG